MLTNQLVTSGPAARGGRPRGEPHVTPRPADSRTADSRTAIFGAAAAEFAARGFAAATVDRIAARARLNKAMVYYHFDGKQALYSEVFREIFDRLGGRLDAIARSDAPTPEKLGRAVDAIARTAHAEPHFPAMMAREMADAGIHLDRPIIASMIRVVSGVVGILRQGQQQGVFRDIDPVHAYFAIVAPLVFFLASRPVRERLKTAIADDGAAVDLRAIAGPDAFERMLAEHQHAVGMIVAAPGRVPARRLRPRPPRSSGRRGAASRSRSNERGPR